VDAARLERLLETSYALPGSLDLDELLGLILPTAAARNGAWSFSRAATR
jgi:hypothetical protein